jgi:hypothetical protein
MTPRERVDAALNHRELDRVPLDLGASAVTGMHASSVYLLRQALKLDPPGVPVKVVDPYQMLGEIGIDLMDALGVDVVGLSRRATFFGFRNEGWKEWRMFDGTPVLVPAGFNTRPEPDGSILQYPEGDRSVPPSARMPKGGYYFDSIIRQPPIDEAKLDPADNTEEFMDVSDADLDEIEADCRAAEATGRSIFASFGGSSFGDISHVPAPGLKHPKGIRDIEEWYVSTVARVDYVRKVFERQCEVALENFKRIHARVGNRVSVAFLSGADFGTQAGPFISRETYRGLYFPFHKTLNDWVHANTGWKVFIHTCGSVAALLDDFVVAGFDILNPVQCSAAGMEPAGLKRRWGRQVTFWGGGVDTQRTLPFGTPDDVRREVRERIAIFSPGGGFVFNTIHNVQAKVPVANLLALFETVRDFGAT